HRPGRQLLRRPDRRAGVAVGGILQRRAGAGGVIGVRICPFSPEKFLGRQVTALCGSPGLMSRTSKPSALQNQSVPTPPVSVSALVVSGLTTSRPESAIRTERFIRL